MKNKIIIILVLIMSTISFQGYSQWINSITVSPPNPTVNDSITVYADLSFPSAGCSDHTQTFSIIGNQIYASALHCLGVLTVICNYTDTFPIGYLPAGSYTFYIQVDAGALPSPCTPGFVPGPNDSITFIVDPAVAVSEIIPGDAVSIYPNPGVDVIRLNGLSSENYPVTVEIFSTEGKKVKHASLSSAESTLEIKELPKALYQVHIRTADKQQIIIPFAVAK